MRKLQKGGSSSGLLGWAARTNYILFERDTSRDGTGPEMVCVENKEKLPQKKAIEKLGEKYWQTQIFLKIITIWADVTIIFSELFHDIHFTTY